MIRPDVIDLRAFYRSPLGLTARRLIRRRLRLIWSDLGGLRLLGLGYATPYLRLFRDEVERTIVAMPTEQGVLHWPLHGPSLTTLVEETELPFPDAFFDRVLLVHSLETAENVRAFLREIWRILTPNGRLLAVVPNRRGLWAHLETSPFGHGQPYAPQQLTRIMRDTLFSPTEVAQALFMPPSEKRFILAAATTWEGVGARLWPGLSGVILLEAEKQIYAPTPAVASARDRRRALAWRPATAVESRQASVSRSGRPGQP